MRWALIAGGTEGIGRAVAANWLPADTCYCVNISNSTCDSGYRAVLSAFHPMHHRYPDVTFARPLSS
jgi:NAD(P)-dependent dehydrogenase (short-subunit alcohol dehydrogenase family)